MPTLSPTTSRMLNPESDDAVEDRLTGDDAFSNELEHCSSQNEAEDEEE